MRSRRKGKILIVDDEEIIRASLSDILQDNGYHTETARSGRQGIDKVVSGDFDLVLLDLKMPVMDGIETLKRIKKLKPKTRVIMLTAYTKTVDVVTAMKEGASYYISKPYVESDLLVTLKEVIDEVKDADKAMPFPEKHFDIISNKIRRDIMRALSSASMRYMEIARELKISDSSVINFHLNMLKECGMIAQGPDNKYFLDYKGRKIADILTLADIYFS